ncbi:MAG: nitroreductase family protein [Oscillospiraceae bacterium]|nr:nitroreductase family protein [Oscillospiraceae bacterium]
MEALQNIRERRSIRQYKDIPVTAEQITQIVEAARFAPTWKNSQTVRYHAVLDKALKDRIAAEGTLNFSKNGSNIRSAAALVVLTTVDGIAGYEPDGSPTTTKGAHWQSFDAGIACQTFCLAAHDLGLGTLIMGIFDEPKIRELLRIPDGESISALIAVGYADTAPNAPKRKETSELLQIIE